MSNEHGYPEEPQSRGEEYLQYICERLGEGRGAVASVNGKTGTVVLNANDVGALPNTTPIPPDLTDDVDKLSGTVMDIYKPYRPLIDATLVSGNNYFDVDIIEGNTYEIINDSATFGVISVMLSESQAIVVKTGYKILETALQDNGRIRVYSSDSGLKLTIHNIDDVQYKVGANSGIITGQHLIEIPYGKNRLNVKKAVGGYYSADAFVALTDKTRWVTSVVYVSNIDRITISGFPTNAGVYCAYLNSDNPNDFAERAWASGTNNGTHVLNKKYAYIGIAWNASAANNTLQIEEGSVATSYEEYIPAFRSEDSADLMRVIALKSLPNKNLFNVAAASGGYYLNGGYHRLASNNTWCISVIDTLGSPVITGSGFPEVSGAQSVYLNSENVTDYAEEAWNSKYNNGTHILKTEYRYVAICWENSSNPTNMQMEIGTKATTYEPFVLSTQSQELVDIKLNAERLSLGIDDINADLNQRLKSVLALPPMFAIIDDDTQIKWSVKKFHDVLVANGVVGGYAAIAKNLKDHENTVNDALELLREYEAEGFGVYLHCYYQAPYWGTDVRSDPENRKLCEEDFVKGLRIILNEYGFFDSRDVFVVPGGMPPTEPNDNEFVKSLAKRHGIKYVINADTKRILDNTYDLKNNRYNVPRVKFDTTDPDGSNLAYLKSKIDECVANNTSIMIMTHVGQWNPNSLEEPTSRLSELIQYCLTSGLVNKNPLELLREREPFYALHEMWDQV